MRLPKVSSLILGIFASMYSAFQKIFLLTLVFGNTLWESIDQFSAFVLKQFSISTAANLKISWWLIGIYGSIHLLGGIAAGIIAGRLPAWITKLSERNDIPALQFQNNSSRGNIDQNKNKKKKRRWWKKPTGIIILTFPVVMVSLSYIFPEFGKNKVYEIVNMIIRSLLIVFVWFTFVAPLILKFFKRLIDKKRIIYSSEIDEIISLFPHLRTIINESWKISATQKGLNRLKAFLSYAFVLLILADFETE